MILIPPEMNDPPEHEASLVLVPVLAVFLALARPGRPPTRRG